MPWKELARTALLGTGHSTLSGQTKQRLQALGIDTEQEEPAVLLEAAAVYCQLIKAGFPLHPFEGELPEASEDTSHRACSVKSTHHLQLILEGKFSAVLPEFIHHLLENGKTIPTSQLPALMSRSDLQHWWDLLEPALGPDGIWLLKQHPDWSRLLLEPDRYDWHTGRKPERLLLIQHLRKTRPGKALELLASTWETESFRDKAAFLVPLEMGLSEKDEPFLNMCLDDSRKEVRRVSAALLAKIPGSEFGERMFRRIVDCFSFKKGKLVVDVPEEPDQEALKDGLLKIHPDWKGGRKTAYIGQIMSVVPPVRWEMHFELDPPDILLLFEETDWSATLLKGLAEAAVFHDDPSWMGALLSHWFENEGSPLWNEPVGQQLLELATPAVVNQRSLDYLHTITGLPDDNTPVFQLLQINDSPWEDELTLLLVDRLKKWMATSNIIDWRSFHYKDFLRMAAIRSNPQLFEILQKGWHTNSPLWYQYEKPVEEMLNCLFFRKEMIREIETP